MCLLNVRLEDIEYKSMYSYLLSFCKCPHASKDNCRSYPSKFHNKLLDILVGRLLGSHAASDSAYAALLIPAFGPYIDLSLILFIPQERSQLTPSLPKSALAHMLPKQINR